MSATLSLSATSKPATPSRGLPVVCIKCGAAGGVHVNLSDVTRFHCTECGEDFTAAEVVVHIHAWRKCLDWLSSCPESR